MGNKRPKFLFLTLHTFSLTGGIEKVCRILSKALSDSIAAKDLSGELEILSLCDQPGDVDINYCGANTFRGYGYQRAKFVAAALLSGIKSETIILSHINLLPVAFLVKFFSKKKKIIMLAHGIEVWREIGSWKKYFFRKHVEIWSVSEFTSQILQTKHQVSAHQIKLLNNCLDPYLALPQTFDKPAYLLERHHLQENQPIITTISRLSSFELYKGYDLVINTLPLMLSEFPDLVYLLGGKADLKEKTRLMGLIAEKGLEKHVILTDFIPDEELIDSFLLADIFVMPSKKEGFGIVFIEAAACGCPVIAGNQDGSTDALLNGELGLLINPESTKELTEAIRETLAKGRSKIQALALQQKCVSNFGYAQYKQKVVKLLKINYE